MTYGGFRRQLGDLDTDEKPVVACLIKLLICYFCLVRQPSSSCLVSFPLPYARTLKGGEPPQAMDAILPLKDQRQNYYIGLSIPTLFFR